ncbi:hypothetical protein HDU76_013627 [Blyttiomyces sp. JEL0837]|nr:hypothetical protein HDU76_013627 [Blyttiomyces sp. JEL0837]
MTKGVMETRSTLVALAAYLAITILSQPVYGLSALPQKTDVLRVGFVSGFFAPYNISDPAGASSVFSQNIASIAEYNGILWMVNETNYNPNILPTTRIELVPINSQNDRGLSLKRTLAAIDNEGIVAVIGDLFSRNTVTMAVGAAINNVLHCAASATTPQLSNQAQGMLALLAKFNVTSTGIVATNDEFGQGLIQSLQTLAPLYNVTITVVVPLQVGKGHFDDELRLIVDAQVQYILAVASSGDAITLFGSAKRMSMLDGTYWWVASTGFGYYNFASSLETKAVLNSMVGVWQVDNGTPWDEDSAGISEMAKALKLWWKSLFFPDTLKAYAGIPRDFNPMAILPFNTTTANFTLATNCVNDSSTSVVSEMGKFYFLNSAGQYYFIQSNQCMRQQYLAGLTPLFGLSLGYLPPANSYMSQAAVCAQTIMGVFDTALKSGVPLQKISNRTFFTAQTNLNGLFGRPYTYDSNGDIVNDQSVLVYQRVQVTDSVNAVITVPIGNWSAIRNSVSFFNDSAPLVFLGNKTAPPPPRQVPIIQFTAKTAMRYAFDAIVAICSLFTVILLIYMLFSMNFKIFKAASPRFLAVIIIGANVSYMSIWLFSQYPMTDASCVTYVWLKYMGFATVFGSLLLKTYRISIIFSKKKSNVNVKNLNDTVLFVMMLVFMGLWAALLAIWTLIPSERPKLVIDSVASIAKNGTILAFNQTPHCEFGDYNFICLGAMVITLAFGVFLTYSVRDTPSAFNESKWIAMALYNWVVIGIVLNAITNFAVKDPDVIFVMEALNVIITQTGVAGFLFVPKMIEIVAGRGNENSTFQSSGTSSNPTTGTTSSMNVSSKTDLGIPENRDLIRIAELQAKLAKVEKELADLKSQQKT